MRDTEFPIHVLPEVIDDLHRRVRATRWPDQLTDTTWEHGADLRYIRDLAQSWVDAFDWARVEGALNAEMPSRRCTIDGLDVHFTRTVPDLASRERGLPLVLLHGWPSSFVEMRALVPRLVRAGHEVIVPSLPGHGFSSIPLRVGFGADEGAAVIASLMTDVLGHERYVAHGGDRGSFVATSLGLTAPANVAGIHLTLPGGIPGEGGDRSAEETEWLTTTAAWAVEEGGYSAIQGTRPQSLAYAMHDSPVGMLAWIVEKHRAWSDCGGDVERCISREQLLTNATIYWVTGTLRADERLDKRCRRAREQFPCGRTLREGAVLGEDGDAITEPDRLVDVVGDEHDRLADAGLDREQLVLKMGAGDRVECAERFVHQQHRRIGAEGSSDADALLLAARQLVWVAIAIRVGVEPDQREQLGDPVGLTLLRPAEQTRDHCDVRADGEVGEESDLLNHVADAATHDHRVEGRNVRAVDQDSTVGRLDEPIDESQRGRLATARRTDEDGELAVGDLEIEIAGRGATVRELLGDMLEGDQQARW